MLLYLGNLKLDIQRSQITKYHLSIRNVSQDSRELQWESQHMEKYIMISSVANMRLSHSCMA